MNKLIGTWILAVAAASAQESITVKIEQPGNGIPGCTTKLGAGTFPVQSWAFGVTTTTPFGSTGSGAGAGKAAISALTIVKQVDECSAGLFGMSVKGAHIPKITLTQTDPTGKLTLMTVKLETAFVTTYQIGGSTANGTPLENVAFSFAKIGITYYGGGA